MKRLACLILTMILFGSAMAESVTVTASQLNGRARPNRKSFVEARFDSGDSLEATGKWSKDHRWIEVEGGETGTVWVSIDYVSSIDAPYTVKNGEYPSIKIRSNPIDGKVVGKLKRGKKIEITAVVLGWGKCSKGWIDLGLVEAVGDE